MSKQEYINAVMAYGINSDRVDEISKVYGGDLSDELKHFISFADSVDFFDEERRALSYGEILDSSSKLGKDFAEKGLIPIIDAYDNIYIVFSFETKKWMKYSISDDVCFKEKDNILEVI